MGEACFFFFVFSCSGRYVFRSNVFGNYRVGLTTGKYVRLVIFRVTIVGENFESLWREEVVLVGELGFDSW